MKKNLFLISFMAVSIMASAQSYKKVKVDLSLGYAIPTMGGGGTKGGVTFTVEPHYRIMDELALGIRFEGAALAYVNNLGNNSNTSVAVLSSYCATGDYYFGNGGFRPFAGAGLGLFNSASININTQSGSGTQVVPGTSQFGFFPRAGFETGHFRMSAEYNIIDNSGYFSTKIGFFFGGGKK